jgi:hypothetical protein
LTAFPQARVLVLERDVLQLQQQQQQQQPQRRRLSNSGDSEDSSLLLPVAGMGMGMGGVPGLAPTRAPGLERTSVRAKVSPRQQNKGLAFPTFRLDDE